MSRPVETRNWSRSYRRAWNTSEYRRAGVCTIDPRGVLEVHLIDGTYELFRHYYALPSATDAQGREVAAMRGVVQSVQGMIRAGATHLGVATDHVIESFRNRLWPGYKTSDGVPPDLLAQFPLLEDALRERGIVVWPAVEFEADDALASAAEIAARDRAGDTGQHLHPRQGPRAVRARLARGAGASPHARHARRGRHHREIRRAAPRRFPTTWPSSATRRTGIRACRAGARNRRRRCWRGSATSKASPRAAATGI